MSFSNQNYFVFAKAIANRWTMEKIQIRNLTANLDKIREISKK